MNLEHKKEELKTLSLSQKENGNIIYQLINDGTLDQIILMIKEKSYKFSLLPKKTNFKLVSNQCFIDKMNDLINFFELSFPPLLKKGWYLSLLLEEKTPYFLINGLYHKGDVDHMKEFLVENMYDNICFIYNEIENKTFFRKLNIHDHLSLKISKNVNILYTFMQRIIWCNYNDNALFYIFVNYKTMIREYEANGKHPKDNIKLYVWNKYDDHWSRLIYNYDHKIKAVEELI